MLGADHAGFLCQRWADAFLDCCEAVLGPAGAHVDRARQQVTYQGHVTGIGVHPLGVDADGLISRASEPDVRAREAALAEAAGGRKLIVRIDRTELSKNIVRGLAAYRELLTTHPEWHGRVVHLAFAYPSRHDLPEYREYTASVQRLASEISEEFGTEDWNPLVLHVDDDYARSLAAYRLADVLLVNPIRDGMNLVAKEGPILSERGCALVLSREAGAAAELGADALLINPFDVSGTAEALHERTHDERAGTRAPGGITRPGGGRHAADPLVRRPAGRAGPVSRPAWINVPAPSRRAIGTSMRGRGARAGQESCDIAAASASSSATTPSGPSTTRSASSARLLTSVEPLQTARPGSPSPRSSATARKAGSSPRSSPQYMTAAAERALASVLSAWPLSDPGGRSSITIRPGSTARPVRSARSASGPRSRSSDLLRLGGAAGVHGERVALVLGPDAAGRARGSQDPGQLLPGRRDAGRDRRRG